MIQLILMIASMQKADRVPLCLNLAMSTQQYVTTYKGTKYYWDTFYTLLCNNSKVQNEMLKIKRWY